MTYSIWAAGYFKYPTFAVTVTTSSYTIGGAGALLSKSVVECEEIAFPELGPESIKRLVVKDLPVWVAMDAKGNDFFAQSRQAYLESKKKK